MADALVPDVTGKPPVAKTADDINDLFNEIDKEEPIKETKKAPKEPDEDDDKKEIKEIEDEDDIELKEPDEEIEKLDLAKDEETIDAPPRKREILKEYPEIFKKFPFLEKMMYRDKQYTEMFGSFDDAKEIFERSESASTIESQLLSGNTEEILREVKDTDKKAFDLIVDDYLVSLAKVDKDAYFHVVGNINRKLIMEMMEEATNTEDENLKGAALILNKFLFGSAKFTAPTRLVEKKDEAKTSEAEQERLSFVKERFETARDDLQSTIDNTLRATITDYIDPRGNMTSYVKKNAVSDAMNYLKTAIAKDPDTVKNLDKLWRSSFDNKFSKDSLGKIKSYYLSKAKASLKDSIMKARAEALKDTSPKREKEEEIETEERPQRRTIATGRPSQPKGKNEMRKGESVTDFFMRE